MRIGEVYLETMSSGTITQEEIGCLLLGRAGQQQAAA